MPLQEKDKIPSKSDPELMLVAGWECRHLAVPESFDVMDQDE